MKRIFNNKIKFSQIIKLIDYYDFKREKRLLKGKQRTGYYYYYSKANIPELQKYDNVLFFKAYSEYAPEIIKKVIFVFD